MQNQDLFIKKSKTEEVNQPFVTSTSNGMLTASTGFSESDMQMTDEMNSSLDLSS